MKILALEFSSARRSVAVADFAGVPRLRDSLARAASVSPVTQEINEAGGKGTRAFAMIEEALNKAGIEREALDCLVVGLGPGSYTGIRVAISIAQGWQLATGIKACGISTVDILVNQALAAHCAGRVHVVIDAQRGEVYWAVYNLADGRPEVTMPLKLAKPEAVARELGARDLIIGPEARNWFPQAMEMLPSAAILAEIGFEGQNFVPVETLEPVYLRETTFVKAPPPRIA